MRIRKSLICALIAVMLCLTCLGACAKQDRRSASDSKPALKVIIIPKFEIKKMAGDFPGEAQFFYEKYCTGCGEVEVPHMPPTGHFFMNEENGVGILVTGASKAAASLSLMALLSSDLFDYSDAYLVSVGCSGGNMSCCTLGDVILVTEVCDVDLGHRVDAHERTNSGSHVMWFPDNSFADYEFKALDADLCSKVYEMVKDVPLRTTEKSREALKNNYPDMNEADFIPSVKKGTSVSGDNYWKGTYGHATAEFIAEYYECPDPYSVSEMEEMATANAAECFDMLGRLISFRVIVNSDLFMDGETPESTWGDQRSFSERVEKDNSETLDIFGPAMHNLFDTASVAIEAILAGNM